MNSSISYEKLMKKFDSVYRLVIVASRRAQQLAKGARPFVDTKSRKAATVALQEIAESKVGYHLENMENNNANNKN